MTTPISISALDGRTVPANHDLPPARTSPTRRRGVLAGAGIVLACAVACSLPLIAAGGFAAGAGALVMGGEAVVLGVVALLTAVVASGMWLRRRRQPGLGGLASAGAPEPEDAGGCGCGGSCSIDRCGPAAGVR